MQGGRQLGLPNKAKLIPRGFNASTRSRMARPARITAREAIRNPEERTCHHEKGSMNKFSYFISPPPEAHSERTRQVYFHSYFPMDTKSSPHAAAEPVHSPLGRFSVRAHRRSIC